MRPSLSVRSYPPYEATHAHDWHQIVLAVDGALAMQVGDHQGAVDEQSFVIVPAARPHRFRGERTNRFVVVNVPPAAGYAGLPDGLVGRLPDDPFLPVDEGLRHLLLYIAFDVRQTGAALADQLALPLLQALGRRVENRQPFPDPLRRALDAAEVRSCDGLDVAGMAAAAGVSLSGLHALFRNRLGTTPGRYLLDRRLDEAERLIAGGRMPLAEVAFAVGFSDQSALTRSLRRRRGTTPGTLRRAGRGGSGDSA